MKKIVKLVMLCTLSVLLTSCVVGKKKYVASENGRWAALFRCDSLSRELASERGRIAHLMNDTTNLGKSLRDYKSLLNSNLDENAKLNQELALRQQELNAREKTINEMQKVIDSQNEKVKMLFDNVKNALLGFSADELSVREEDGKIYVAMSEKLLFEPGKANVNEQGKEALGKLAQVLNRQTDIDVFIEGHTDSIPIKNATFKDNWDLSVIRATSVVRILTETYMVNPLQIQPAGRGEFKPIDTNKTPEGRARNRRTEIIMQPKLDALYKMLRQ